jgi:hypothetical protein
MMVHAYNSNYSGSRDRRITVLRSVQVKAAETPCLKNKIETKGCQWLTPVILVIQEAEIRRITFQIHPGPIFSMRPYLEKTLHKKGLVEWLKV